MTNVNTDPNLISVMYAAPGRIHDIRRTIIVISPDNQYRHRVKPGLHSKVFTHLCFPFNCYCNNRRLLIRLYSILINFKRRKTFFLILAYNKNPSGILIYPGGSIFNNLKRKSVFTRIIQKITCSIINETDLRVFPQPGRVFGVIHMTINKCHVG